MFVLAERRQHRKMHYIVSNANEKHPFVIRQLNWTTGFHLMAFNTWTKNKKRNATLKTCDRIAQIHFCVRSIVVQYSNVAAKLTENKKNTLWIHKKCGLHTRFRSHSYKLICCVVVSFDDWMRTYLCVQCMRSFGKETVGKLVELDLGQKTTPLIRLSVYPSVLQRFQYSKLKLYER